MKRISICNVPVDVISKTQALERCRQFLHDGSPHQIVTVNPEFIMEAQKNIVFRAVLQKSDLALADGIGIRFAARYLYGLNIERIPGVEFVEDICALAEKERVSVFFLGGRAGVAEKVAKILQERFPGLRVSGRSEEFDVSIYRNIDIDILFVALGAPKQELWIAQNLARFSKIKIAMGVGGAFDMISGKIKRAPQVMQRLGLEWLWRLMREPRRSTRIWRAVFVFSFLVLENKKAEE